MPLSGVTADFPRVRVRPRVTGGTGRFMGASLIDLQRVLIADHEPFLDGSHGFHKGLLVQNMLGQIGQGLVPLLS